MSIRHESQHRPEIEAAIAVEKNAVTSIKNMAHNNSAALLALWSWGDGRGGTILDMIASEIGERRPSDRSPPAYKTVKVKKVIQAGVRKRVFERDAYRCVHCDYHIDLTVDHSKPESKGGTLDFDNLQTLCRPCNSSKGSKQ